MFAGVIKTDKSHVLNIAGFLYSKSLTQNRKVFWKCKKCDARAVTREQLNHGEAVEVVKGYDIALMHCSYFTLMRRATRKSLRLKLRRT